VTLLLLLRLLLRLLLLLSCSGALTACHMSSSKCFRHLGNLALKEAHKQKLQEERKKRGRRVQSRARAWAGNT
jgi:hypothetical protein